MQGKPQDATIWRDGTYIRLLPRQVLTLMLGIIGVLTMAGIATDVSQGVFGHNHVYGLVPMFNTSTEGNIPTFYSSLSLMGSAVLLFFISKVAALDQRLRWKALAALFLYVSVDEAAQIHEMATLPARKLLHASGIWFFGWVIVAIPIIAALAAAFIPFVLKLPLATRRLLIPAAAIFVFAGVGMEMISAPYAERFGELYLPYRLITDVEEFLEMVGVALWNYALLCHLNALLVASDSQGLIITTRLVNARHVD